MNYEAHFLLYLLFTLLVEVPVLFLLVRYLPGKKKLRTGKVIFTGIISSTLTLPYLWFALAPFIDSRYYPFAGELMVTAAEALIINQLLSLSFKKALLISFAANLTSFVLGSMIF